MNEDISPFYTQQTRELRAHIHERVPVNAFYIKSQTFAMGITLISNPFNRTELNPSHLFPFSSYINNVLFFCHVFIATIDI